METKKIIGKINETKCWFSEKINKNKKSLARFPKEKKFKQIKCETRKEIQKTVTDYDE